MIMVEYITKDNTSLRPMDIDETLELVNHITMNHIADEYTGGRIIDVFMMLKEKGLIVSIQFNIGDAVKVIVSNPEAESWDTSLYQYAMDWLDKPNTDIFTT
jgi:hypothetical protein